MMDSETADLLEVIFVLVGIVFAVCLVIWLVRKLKTTMDCAKEGQSIVRESLDLTQESLKLNREFKGIMEKQIELQQESNRLMEELIVALKQGR